MALAGLVAGWGCGGGEAAPTGPAAAAAGQGAPLTRGTFERVLLLTGELESVHSIAIKAPQTAMFQMRIQFMAEEGSVVEPGDPLLDFDNSSLAEQVRDLESRILDADTQIVTQRNELASALKDLEIELAEREFERDAAELEASVDPEVLSPKEYGDRLLAYTGAREEYEETLRRIELTRARGAAELDVLIIDRDKLRKDMFSAQEGVERLSIKAPARGLVVYEQRDDALRYQEGDSCWPGQGIVRLPDLSEMQVAFGVNEVDAPSLREGMQVGVTIDAFPGRELTGELIHIPSMAVKQSDDSTIAVFKVLARLSETWVGEMKPGMSAKGRIALERRGDAPLVDRRHVRYDGTDYWLTSGPQPRRIRPVARNERYYVLSDEEYVALGGAPAGEGGETARRVES